MSLLTAAAAGAVLSDPEQDIMADKAIRGLLLSLGFASVHFVASLPGGDAM